MRTTHLVPLSGEVDEEADIEAAPDTVEDPAELGVVVLRCQGGADGSEGEGADEGAGFGLELLVCWGEMRFFFCVVRCHGARQWRVAHLDIVLAFCGHFLRL